MKAPPVDPSDFKFTAHARYRASTEGISVTAIVAALENPYRIIRSQARGDAWQYLIDVDGVHARAIVTQDGAILTVMRHRDEKLCRQLRQFRGPRRRHGRKRQKW
jgi:hypothetical protein